MPSIRAAADRHSVAAVLAVAVLALLVATVIHRPPADFAKLAPIVVLRDAARQPLWEIRLAPAAHQIAVDTHVAPTVPAGQAYQLWLATPGGAGSLGLLPAVGRKIIPEIPALIDRLGQPGELFVTLEPARGSDTGKPSGPPLFHAVLPAAAPRGG